MDDTMRTFYANPEPKGGSPSPTQARYPTLETQHADAVREFYNQPTDSTAPTEEPAGGKDANTQAVADFYASELRLPEGFEASAEHLASFKQLVNQHFISAKAQQALLDYAGKVFAPPVDAFKALDEQIAADDARARADVARIPEEDIRRAREVVREANDPELNRFLEVSGLGNSAPMIRLLASLARR